ncbi:AAA-domain-containing protein [Polyplosphaeria fusca]|uniref:AAA-domain-containing protein n=1 Tax=Polyplosphaeria fusca TaxID=682080 RepID=A0A9P4RAN6_9PLEO|nr:AAA-domain-containing protein [Polyplosphaeria fusca]
MAPPKQKPTLFIEVKTKERTPGEPSLVRADEIARDVERLLVDNFERVKVGQCVESHLPSGPWQRHIDRIKIADHTKHGSSEIFHWLADNQLDITVYSLDEEEPHALPDDSSPYLTVSALPNKDLDGLWKSLIFAEAIPDWLLRVLWRMLRMSISDNGLDTALVVWHNVALLWGPPGSGKTTLAQALAQRLSIRLSNAFSSTKLVQVNSSTLTSKWFGESSKLVGQLFDALSQLALDETTLVIVLIDEVETLASSREDATRSNECADAIRSTNEFLQGLDRLRRQSNVIFLCTSNLKDNLDSAFIDRCAIKQFMDTPSIECVYEIFRSVINEFMRNGLVYRDAAEGLSRRRADNEATEGFSPISSTLGHDADDAFSKPEDVSIPELEWVNANLAFFADSAPRELRNLAQRAAGLSGRTLRRLPMLALAKHTVDEPCELGELLRGLKRAINEECLAQHGDVMARKQKTHHSIILGDDEGDTSGQLHSLSLEDGGEGEKTL